MAAIVSSTNDLIAEINPEAKKYVEEYNQAKAIRSPYEADWRRVAEMGLPREYGGWVMSNTSGLFGAGAARESRLAQFDSTLARSIPKFGAVLERLLTPNSQVYHQMRPINTDLLRVRAVRLYYQKYNELLFSHRYHWRARFSSTQGEMYQSIGAYGNACKMITWRGAAINKDSPIRHGRDADKGGFLYRSIPFSRMYWMIDHEEQTCKWFRRIDWTAKQALSALGDKCPKLLKEKADNGSNADQARTWEFFQLVMPTSDYDQRAFDYRRFPLTSLYVFVEKPEIVAAPAGYYSLPMVTPRHFTEGGSPYGYGPAQIVLSSVGTVNSQRKTMLKVGQKKADPPLLTHDDGILNGTVDQRPGASNPGGVNASGQKLVHTLDVGDLQVAEKLHQQEKDDIEEPFFVQLLRRIHDEPQKTATQILDDAARDAATVSPVMGRMHAEDLGPMVEREIDLCERMGIAPEKPAELLEAGADYELIYTSPLAKSARAESVAGFSRLADMAMNYFKATQDAKPLRLLNFERAMPAIADQQSVPADWLNDPVEIAAEAAKAERDKQISQVTDALPGVASLARTAATNPAQAAGGAAPGGPAMPTP